MNKPTPKERDYLFVLSDPELRKTVETMAKAEDRSMSSMARILVREALNAREIGEHIERSRVNVPMPSPKEEK